jgi:hypothetical protein
MVICASYIKDVNNPRWRDCLKIAVLAEEFCSRLSVPSLPRAVAVFKEVSHFAMFQTSANPAQRHRECRHTLKSRAPKLKLKA